MVTISPLNIGYLNATLAEWYDLPTNHPAASTPDRAAILCFHLATANHSVLVDAAAYAFPPDFESMVIPGEQRPGLKDQLLTLGIEADDITDLVITHPHVDHINGLSEFVDGQHLPLFPKARHYLGAADWQPETFGSLEQDTLMVIEACGLLELVSGKLELGDGLSIVPMPGETPGHQGLYLNDGEVEAYFTGDLYHHPLEFKEDINVVWAEPQTMRASKRAIAEQAARSGAKVYFSHIEGAYRAEQTGTQLRWLRTE